MSMKVKDSSTSYFAKEIINVSKNIDKYKRNFEKSDYEFLSTKRMSDDYLDYIKL